ncbi:hypothetical protein OG21DRAFT_1416031, partial [Imleria badia]
NLCIEKGLVHNAHVIMTSIHRRFIEVWFPDSPESHCIPCISFNFSPSGSDWTVTQKQFPLHLAYTTTFNGCQGLTLARSALDLCIDPFAHGQLYTALARFTRREDTLLLFPELNEEMSSANIVVYRKLLL